MRHFLAVALAPAGLPPRMLQPAGKGPLVTPPSCAQALPARLLRARLRAIALAVVTASTHPQLPMTPGTVPHAVADDVDRTTSSPRKAGRSVRIRSLSVAGYAHPSIAALTPRRLEEVCPRAFTFCGACWCYRAGDRKKTSRLADGPTRVRRGRKRIRSTKQMDRLKLW